MPAIPWLKIAGLVALMLIGGLIMHKFDLGKIEHLRGEVTAEKLKLETAKKEALVWATEKQRTYDEIAIQTARKDATALRQVADAATKRAHDLASIPPRVLVRGCITYEFVRHLDAAITGRAPSALPQPAGKPNDACAPTDAVTVVRWLLGVIEVAEVRGERLGALQAFVRAAQAAR